MLAPNTILQNRYRIIRVIGQGGMGAVYEAIDERLGSTVALKQTFFSGDELGRAFEGEARLLANLRHPALPRVSDHFVEDGGQFLVMEFIPGDDLAKLLKLNERPFAVDQVLDWGYQLLDALDYLHSHHPPIIHRDIKPQNLKLTERSQIILLDFGLAKGAPQLLAGGTASSLFGYTLNYAPLEQIQCAGTDSRSDLYSLGATLYNLMTAITPPGSLSRAAAIAIGELDPLLWASDLNPEIPEAVAEMLDQSMSLRADRRPSTASEMRRAFGEASQHPSPGHPVFGIIPTGASPAVFRERKPASSARTRVVDPLEAPTRLMEAPLTIVAPDEVAMTARPDPVRPDVQTFPWLPEWFRYVWAIALVVVFLFVAIGISRLILPSRVGINPPEIAAPKVPLTPSQPPPPPTPPPFPPLPAFAGSPPNLILGADELLTPRKGFLTLRWSPVFGATAYRVELANADFSRTWIQTTTSLTVYKFQFTGQSGFVRITAIGPSLPGTNSRWWEIKPEASKPTVIAR